MDNIAISVEHVKKIYKLYDRNRDRLKDALGFSKKPLGKEHYALNDVSFQVGQGETVGIIGTNGSGKSTILKIITGVLNPTDGEVKVNGRISALLELGAGFNMEYTGIENIYLNGTVLGHSKKYMDEHFDEIVDFAELWDFLDTPIKNFSSGMTARLGFSVATMVAPDILICDEILAVGDYLFQQKCMERMNRMLSGGTTLLFVSHTIDTVRKLCDHAIWLDHGVAKMVGEVNEVCDAYMKLNR